MNSILQENPIKAYNAVITDFSAGCTYIGEVSIVDHWFFKRLSQTSTSITYLYKEIRRKDSPAYTAVQLETLAYGSNHLGRVSLEYFRNILQRAEKENIPPDPIKPEYEPVKRNDSPCFFDSPGPQDPSRDVRVKLFPSVIQNIVRPKPVDINWGVIQKLIDKEVENANLVPFLRNESKMEVLHFFRIVVLRWRKYYVTNMRPDLLQPMNVSDCSFKAWCDAAVIFQLPAIILNIYKKRYEKAIEPVYIKSTQ